MGKRGKPSGGDQGGSGPSKKPRKSAGQQAPSKKGGAKPTPQAKIYTNCYLEVQAIQMEGESAR